MRKGGRSLKTRAGKGGLVGAGKEIKGVLNFFTLPLNSPLSQQLLPYQHACTLHLHSSTDQLTEMDYETTEPIDAPFPPQVAKNNLSTLSFLNNQSTYNLLSTKPSL